MPDARTESSSPSPATGPTQDPAVRRRPRRRRGPRPTGTPGSSQAGADVAQPTETGASRPAPGNTPTTQPARTGTASVGDGSRRNSDNLPAESGLRVGEMAARLEELTVYDREQLGRRL